jgi:hypothetical protein
MAMKTQIKTLFNGSKNQILNSGIDYSILDQSSSHTGHAGVNRKEVANIWLKVLEENPTKMEIELFNIIFTLRAHKSYSGKTTTYLCNIQNHILENHFKLDASKNQAYISIIENTIMVSNGNKSFVYICPSLVTIL